MKKKMLSLILALCMILSTMVTMSVTTLANDATGITTDAEATVSTDTFANATSGTTIVLMNRADLLLFHNAVKGGNALQGVIIKLGADITVNEGMDAMAMNPTSNVTGLTLWTPAQFSGTLDGLKTEATDTTPAEYYTISGLYMDGGMFGHLWGHVRNVNFDNCYSYGTASSAGIVSSNPRNSSTMTNVHITNSHVIAKPNTSGWSFAGGFGGMSFGTTIRNCSFDGKVESDPTYTGTLNSFDNGGIIGKNINYPLTIENTTNNADVISKTTAGGFVGHAENTVTIKYSVNKGTISIGDANTAANANCGGGGFVAYVPSNHTVIVEDCVNEGSVSSNFNGYSLYNSLGGILGRTYGTAITVKNCINKGEISSECTAGLGGIVGRNLNGGTIENSVNFGNVISRGASGEQRIAGILGDNNIPTPLSNCANFGNVTAYVNGSSTSYTGGLIGFSNHNNPIQNCLNAGDVTGVGFASPLIGFASWNYYKDKQYQNNVLVGTTYLVCASASANAFWGGENFLGVISNNYYVSGTLKYKATADATEWTTFTEGKDGFTALDSVDALKGVDGVKLLTAAGYDFVNAWTINKDGLPVPTTLAVDGNKPAPDAELAISYKGYQMGLAGTEAEGFIRFVAGINNIEGYKATGFDVIITVAGTEYAPAAPLTTNTVYQSLTANGNIGAIKASDFGCTYLSALALSDMPDDAIIELTPTLTTVEDEIVKGTTVVLIIENGAVVAQYAN